MLHKIPWVRITLMLLTIVLLAWLAACGPRTSRVSSSNSADAGRDSASAKPAAPRAALADATSTLTATSVITTVATATAIPKVVAPPEGIEERQTLEDSPLSQTGVAIDQMLSNGLEGQPFRGAVLAALHGQVILSRGYDFADSELNIPNRPQTSFRIGSITKAFTAIAILQLQDRGRLHVQDAVCEYLPECPPAWKDITLHHLLTHTSGIPELTVAPDFAEWATEPATPLEVMARFLWLPLEFPPGARWEYSNSNYIVLGVVLEQAALQAYTTFVRTQILEPVHMEDSGFEQNLDTVAIGYQRNDRLADPIDMSVPFAAGALYASAEDLYRWDQALRIDEAKAGTLLDGANQLLPSQLLNELFLPHAPMPDSGPASYGYGWIVSQDAHGHYAEHVGTINGFTAKIRRYLDLNAVIIVLSNQEGINPNPIVAAIVAKMFGS